MIGKNWHIIVNPAACGGKAQKHWEKTAVQLLKKGLAFEVYLTEQKGHATTLADEIIARGGRHILGVGGDGTNSEIVHGILSQTHCPSSEIIYTLFPLGRGNDWARTYGFKANTTELLKRMEEGKTVFQDIGKVIFQGKTGKETRFFVNVAGMAYDGYLVKTSEEKTGGIRGAIHYQLMILYCLASYRAPSGTVRFNGKEVSDKFYLINVGLCKYSGGGMQLVPHAEPNDGLLALTIARNVPKWDVVLQTPRFYNGTLGDYRLVDLYQSKSIEVSHEDDLPILLEVDGEYIGTSPASFAAVENALKILI